ncbi:MAG TPA: AMP-binding protein [Burkholderiaceae bacterium]|nr:AMP-binding protein [Burkholderiaceae bacterium]
MSAATLSSQLERFLAEHQLADYPSLCERAQRDPDWFWRAVMSFHRLHFFRPFDTLLDTTSGPQWPRWCVGGTTSLAYNCLDRTIEAGRADHCAIEWVGEDGDIRSLRYSELSEATQRVAGGLKALGIAPGDVVGIYLPMVPETIIAFLAIVGIGAIALPVFSGFSAAAVVERLSDADAKCVVTADYTLRRGRRIGMQEVIAEAAGSLPSLAHVVVVPRSCDEPLRAPAGADQSSGPAWVAWSSLARGQARCVPAALDAETTAMIVYTSGTTGKPKGTVHTHCGFMTKVALDFGLILDLQPADRLLWMSDMGWLTGPILAAAVPLMGATLILAEGVPDYPEPGRLWQLVQTHRVSFLGVAPTMVRAFMQQPGDPMRSYDLSSLRITAATGEPWTPEAWTWFRERVGQAVPLLNYSGGTEIGGGILAGTVLHRDLEPCAFGGPIPGMGAAVVDEAGRPLGAGEVGELALTVPSIGLTRGFWRAPERYIQAYWSRLPGVWIHGDFASVNACGHWFIHGRSDDTIKIAGKRTGPAEVEAAVLSTGRIAEAAAIGIPDPIKGAAVVVICVPARGADSGPQTVELLRDAVTDSLGVPFRPKAVLFASDLPKTRTLKIMRRLVRSMILGQDTGDLSGLVNPEALPELASLGQQYRHHHAEDH